MSEPHSSEQLTATTIPEDLATRGFARVPAAQFKHWLHGANWQAWSEFAASWNDLGVDTYMADGGRYRHRRFEAHAVSAQSIQRKPPQPHYQSRDYNALN